jgi:hypothetical protein
MFTIKEKQEISDKVQKILRETNHPGLPLGEIDFSLHVDTLKSWADIKNNGYFKQKKKYRKRYGPV